MMKVEPWHWMTFPSFSPSELHTVMPRRMRDLSIMVNSSLLPSSGTLGTPDRVGPHRHAVGWRLGVRGLRRILPRHVRAFALDLAPRLGELLVHGARALAGLAGVRRRALARR